MTVEGLYWSEIYCYICLLLIKINKNQDRLLPVKDGNVSIGNLLSGPDSRMDRHGEKTGVRKNAEYMFLNILFLTR